MPSIPTKIHLEIQTSDKNPVGILRSSYRDGSKTKHKQFGRITGKTLEELKILRLAFRGKVITHDDPNAFTILSSKEYGASCALMKLARQIGLHRSIFPRSEAWVDSVLAMVVGRLVYAGSKLSLCHQSDNSCLWELFGVEGSPDVDKHCYDPLDKLLERQDAIQKNLANKHLTDGHLVLYDITSSYFEGEYSDSDIVKYGYNRDKKKGYKQVVIGLVCSSDGCPVGVEIYPGNTKDETTVIDKIHEVKEKYGLKKIIFVGDRGMVTKSNIEKLKDEEDLNIITALTHGEMSSLHDRKVIHPDLFDDFDITEVVDPDEPEKRYCLCRNPQMQEKEKQTRLRLIELSKEGMKKVAGYKNKTTTEILGARVNKVLSKYKVAKFIDWEVTTDSENKLSTHHTVKWSIKEGKIAHEELFDGCYIITTDVAKEEMKTQAVVASYKSLTLVEQAFRNLKTVQLEMRPIYHKTDDRIRAHLFLCMLAYYLQWQMKKRLQPLFDTDGQGKDRQWTFDNVIQTLKQITKNKVTANGVEFFNNSKPTKNQEEILQLLQVAI